MLGLAGGKRREVGMGQRMAGDLVAAGRDGAELVERHIEAARADLGAVDEKGRLNGVLIQEQLF